MKKFLITGSNGLLGQKIVYALLNRTDVQIIATSRGSNRITEKRGYIYEELDITDKAAVTKAINKYRPDVVINTAAMTNVDACETDKEGAKKMNVGSVRNLVEALEDMLPSFTPHLIHLSTDFIFDGQAGPYRETDIPNPLGYYAQTKVDAEEIVKTSRLKWAIARTIIIYGIVDNMSRSNVVLWAKEALTKGQKINVVDDQFRSPTLAEDLADGCILIADKGATGIYHLSGKEVMSILELVYKVADFFKLDKSYITPVKSETIKQPAKRPPRTGFILDKAVKDLGYNPHSFEAGLKILQQQLTAKSS